ncbi:hypothetical protein DUNSADRAFT_2996 [Dunaliella salina]|uniref:Uncharacterized protein n=1 Tax=Dunaliella salina TaxID=3046 RepID=A0ABQ7FVP9_DUNSA|nr:hypothetical protein DUNSADRAFT_2996 [Dunaliella salina]|eukprot:KAF5826472.1 hypothetical protein DUNSADRAFT_2996 [Dunaliella salina]
MTRECPGKKLFFETFWNIFFFDLGVTISNELIPLSSSKRNLPLRTHNDQGAWGHVMYMSWKN